jgi:putative endonuclease
MSESKQTPNNSRQKLGRWGESVAATHLEASGYKISGRNWRCVHGEIDLIAEKQGSDGRLIAFVEVKTRRGRDKGTPEEAITPRKARKLVLTAQLYLAEQNITDADWQIDLVAVELDRGGKLLRCEHIEHIVWG